MFRFLRILLGTCQAAPPGASKPKSPFGVWGCPTSSRVAWVHSAPPGISMSVDCRRNQLLGGHCGWMAPTWLTWLCLHWAPSAWPAPHPMFTCVSGGGVPAWPPPESLLCRSEEVLVPVPTLHAPHSCPQPVLETRSGHSSSIHDTFSIHPHPRIAVQFFLFIDSCAPSSPRPGIGNLFVWVRRGSSVFVLRWSMGVFQKMVILYDLSWNLF